MKRGAWILLMLAAIAVVFFRGPHRQVSERRADGKALSEAPLTTAGPEQSSVQSVTGALTNLSALAAFDGWVATYIDAPSESKAGLVREGAALALARREEMLRLIQSDPERAVESAIAPAIRKQLPASIRDVLEEQVTGTGRLAVYALLPGPDGSGNSPSVVRELTLNNARKYTAHVPNALKHFTTGRNDVPFHGVAIGDEMAVAKEPGFIVEKDEAQPGGAMICALCAASTEGLPDGTLLNLGGTIVSTCSREHADLLNERVMTASAELHTVSSAAIDPPFGNRISFTQGQKTLLYIRVLFPDDPQEPISEAGAYALMNDVNEFLVKASYNVLSVRATVTPLIMLPQPKAYYAVIPGFGGSLRLLSDAVEAASRAGYNRFDYDLDVVQHTVVPGPNIARGGLSIRGGRGNIFQSPGANTVARGLGFNFGLGYANSWDTRRPPGPPNPNAPNPNFPTDPDSFIGHDALNAPGRDDEEGDPYDLMGNGNAVRQISHYSSPHKHMLSWLTDNYIRDLRSSSTNRLYAYDAPDLVEGRTYALRIRKDYQRTYWVDFRHLWTNNPWLSSGVELHWGAWSGSGQGTSQLLDTTPGTSQGLQDAAVVLGRTLVDEQRGMYLTPVAKGGSGSEQFIDVVTHFGPFPSNLPPVLTLAASELFVPADSTVTFTAAATDPNGDKLAYWWDFSDSSVGSNSPVHLKTFTTDGKYVVRCEVSDMKGGVASAFVVVHVGSPTTFIMSGQVLDTFGQPVQGMRVHNGDLGANYRFGLTDSQGFYAIGNIPAGSYINEAFLYGYRTVPADFNNPVILQNGDAANLDHIATPLPRVKIEKISDADEATLTPGVFRISRTGPNNTALPVPFVTSGTAGAGTAYEPFTTNVITIAAGQTSTNLLVRPRDNGSATGPTEVTVTLRLLTNEFRIQTLTTNVGSNTVFYTVTNSIAIPGWELLTFNQQQTWFQTYPVFVLDNAEASVAIKEKDPLGLPSVSVFTLDSVAVESGDDSGIIVVQRFGDLTDDLAVRYAVSGTASNGLDIHLLSGTIVIPAGLSIAILPVQARDDLFVEGDEQVLVTVLADPAYNGAGSAAIVSLVDNDLPIITVNAPDAIAAEPGQNTARFTVIRSGDFSADLLVNYLITGNAIAGADFQPLSGSVIIPAGEVSADITLTPITDAILESNEVVNIFISESPEYNVGSPHSAVATIQDDELPSISLEVGTGTATEGSGAATIVLTRSGPTNNSVTVNFAVGGTAISQADYAAIGTNIVIPAGATTATINISALDDRFWEVEENIIVQLVEGPAYNLTGTLAGTVTIPGNDGSELVSVGFLLRNSAVSESAGNIQIAVGMSENPPTNRSPVVVEWHITGGSATTNADYSLLSTGYVIFVHDGPRVTNINVQIRSDSNLEANETLFLTLFDPDIILTNTTVSTNGTTNITYTRMPTNAYLGAHLSHTLTILDDDLNFVSVTATNFQAFETGPVPSGFLVTRTGSLSNPLTVRFTLTGTASERTDFDRIGNTVTFASGVDSVLIPIIPVDDRVEEYTETVQINLASAPGGQIGNGSASIAILDNDGTIQFSASDYEVSEDIGAAFISVFRSGDTNIPVTVDYTVSNGSAVAPGDYFANATGTLSFAPGEISKTITVQIANDSLVEPRETIELTLSNPSGGVPLGGQKRATLSILDNDVAFEFARTVFRVNENGTNAVIEVLRNGLVNLAGSVFYGTANGTASNTVDYVGATNLLRFEIGETNKTFTIPINNDLLFEGDETVLLRLTDPAPGTVLGPTNTATLVIVEDESVIQFSSLTFSAREHFGFATGVVERLGGVINPVVVDFRTLDGTALAGTDYLSQTGTLAFAGDAFVPRSDGSGTIEFRPGESNKVIVVPLIDDVVGEGLETFRIALSNARGGAPNVIAGSTKLGTITNTTINLLDNEAPGSLDLEYTAGSGPNARVASVAVQPDQRVVFGGEFTTVNNINFSRIARLQTGGSIDNGFNPGVGANSNVLAVASQLDGKVLVGGLFTSIDGTNRVRIARLNADGTVDLSFNPGSGANGAVRAVASQPDGKVLIGGEFTQVNGFARNRLARLNTDGTVDTTFAPSVAGAVYAIAVQTNDSRIVIGGAFGSVSGTPRNNIARINPNGGVDTTFNPGVGANQAVRALAIQRDGKVIAGGAFTTFAGTAMPYLARLQTTGALDTTFNAPAGANDVVYAVGVDLNGRIYVGGAFTTYDGVSRNHYARLRSSGALDPTFAVLEGANTNVVSIGVQTNGALIIAGDFTTVDGVARRYIARIHGDEKYRPVGVELASAQLSVLENAGAAQVTVVRTGDTNLAFSVTLGTTNRVAIAGEDYRATNIVINFAAGETAKVVSVPLLDDSAAEGDEDFGIFLTGAPPNVDQSGVVSGRVLILDDEQFIQFSSANYFVDEGAGNLAVSLTRVGGISGGVVVTLTTSNITAASGSDYSSYNNTVDFDPGESQITILIPITDDTVPEGEETFGIRITSPSAGALGVPSDATVTITDNDALFGLYTFANTNAITVFDASPAVPYPSTINVSGLTGLISKVTVSLVGVTHTFPADMDVLLVSPAGSSVLLMSDAGGGHDINGLTLRFDDEAPGNLPQFTPITSVTNRPTDYSPDELFPAPAPNGAYARTLESLNGQNPNGSWSLFVMDSRGADSGIISSGWRLSVKTVDPVTTNDLSLHVTTTPSSVEAGQLLTYNIMVTNRGPLTASGVRLTNTLPASAAFVLAKSSQGACAHSNGTVVCDLGQIGVGSFASVTLRVNPTEAGSITNRGVVVGDQPEIAVSNNVASVTTTITPAQVADLAIGVLDSPDPVLAGGELTYTISLTNRGPLIASDVVIVDEVPAGVQIVSAFSPVGSCGISGNTVSCFIGPLSVGGRATIVVTARPVASGSMTNRVRASTPEPDLTPAAAFSVTQVLPAADLVLTHRDAQDPFPLGGVLSYIVTVSNAGPISATGVNVINPIPTGAGFIGAFASQGACSIVADLIICNLGAIPNGGTATMTVDIQPLAVGVVNNTARVLAAEFDPNQQNNSADETTFIFSSGTGLVITPTTNAATLASAVTSSSSTGIRVTSTVLSAHRSETGATSSGLFSIGAQPYTYSLTQPGIVLSTGNVKDYETGPNTQSSLTTSYFVRATPAQESLLDPITGVGTNTFRHFDVTQLDIRFDMLPGFDRVEFKVVFGSEEYVEFVGSSFIDGFGIYLNGTNIAFNAGGPVNINHPDMKPFDGTELDGILAPNNSPILSFSALVSPGSSNNTLTFIVADTTDSALDTTVFVSSLQGAEAPNADLSIAMTASPEPVVLGSNVNYNVTIANRGPFGATNVIVTDSFPNTLTYVSSSISQGSCSFSNGVLTCLLGDLARGSNAFLNIIATALGDNRITNSVHILSDLPDLRPTNDTAFAVSRVIEPGTFFNTQTMVVSDASPSVPYPSVITISNVVGTVGKITITLSELSHDFPADLDVLLVGPQGQSVLLMSDVGADKELANVTLRFDDFATDGLSINGQITPGTYRPTNNGSPDPFHPPAPGGPYGDTLGVFLGTNPNGPWSLYITDDQGSDSGILAGGWRLAILTQAPVLPELLVQRQSATEAIISWPAAAADYVLESSLALGSDAAWNPVLISPSSANGRLSVTVQLIEATEYFRLRKGTP